MRDEAAGGRALGLLLLGLAILARGPLESRLATHLLVQFPLLSAAGALLAGPKPPAALAPWNRGGATGLALAAAILAFWMLPRAIDATLVSPVYEVAKLASLPLAGAALAWSLPALPWLARQLLAAQAIAMAAALGWLYTALPERLCLRYLRREQDVLGAGFLLLALSAFLLWIGRLLRGPSASPAGPRPGTRMRHPGPAQAAPGLLGSNALARGEKIRTGGTCSSPSSPTMRSGPWSSRRCAIPNS